jgi:hypothetical protein
MAAFVALGPLLGFWTVILRAPMQSFPIRLTGQWMLEKRPLRGAAVKISNLNCIAGRRTALLSVTLDILRKAKVTW